MTRTSRIAALWILIGASTSALAQGGPSTVMNTDWRERNAPNGELKAYDSTLLGDAIDLSSGRLSFETVDVSLPGNCSLPVEIRRRLNPSQMQSGDFADWQLAIPTISTKILLDEWVASPPRRWGKIRCSGPLANALPSASWPTHLSPSGAAIPPANYSDGVILDVPGRVQTQLLDKTVAAGWPSTAAKVTTEGWYVECLTNIDGAGTEGFVAVAPNGDRYKFDYLAAGDRKSEFDIWQVNGNIPGLPPVYWKKMGVYYDVLAVSRVTDVNGNWVQYTYNSAKRLISIQSNDGRLITIDRPFDQINHVYANGRTWTYTTAFKNITTYKPPINVNGAPGSQNEVWGSLTTVTLPNGRQWIYNLANLQAKAVPGTTYTWGTCKQFNQTVSVTHPDGVTGTFSLEEVSLRLGAGATGSSGPYCPNTSSGQSSSAQVSDVMAVTHKTLSGPGMTSATWDYSYSDDGTQIFTTIQQPDGSKRIEYHPTPYAFSSARVHARLTKEEIYPTAASATPLEVKTYSYVQEPAAGSNFLSNPVQDTFRPVRLSDTVITRGSDIYTTHAVFNTDRTLSSYSYGFPVTVQQYSNVNSGTRQTDTVYAHNTSKWILGLPSTITKNGTLFDHFVYDTLGHVLTHERFGSTWRTYTYSTLPGEMGMPASMSDAVHPPTYFVGWLGGIPTHVNRADGYHLDRAVDANGRVTSITDWNGNAFGYSYDDVGRLTGIDRPGSWTDTSIGYAYPSGSLVQTQTFGTERMTTSYDAMLRPVQVLKESTLSDVDPIYVRNVFDAVGRKTFTSLPEKTPGSSIGIQTSYDALDRVTQTAETAPGGGSTSYEYLAGNKVRITDPLGYQTTNTSSGYGSPSDGNLTRTVRPEGVLVDFGYNIYGNQTSISQLKDNGSYLVSTFDYDARQRLCRKTVPETGVTLYDYDDANEMTAYAEGQGAGSSCLHPLAVPGTVSLGYNAIGRLLTTNYPSAPDISRTYDPNGNLLTLNRGGSNWTYTYNALDLIESESLQVDGLTFLIDEAYEWSGALKSKQYPSGRVYLFPNDGLDRPIGVSFGGINYLSSILYHPNGKIKTLNRGSGGTFQQDLNPRQLVSYIGGNWGTSLSFLYDAAGHITSIDSPNNNYDRGITYDGVGRLKTASGPWGGGNYYYDTLSNLAQRIEGPREVDVAMDTLSNHVSSVLDSAVSGASRSYSYDGRGNVTSDGLHGFTYDDANQPTSISGADAGSFVYDGNLRRVKQVVNGKTIYSVYDLSGAILTRDDATSGLVTEYVSLQGQTFMRVANGTPSFPLNDQLGTAYMVADANGGITAANTYNFTPFGEGIGNDPGMKNEQGYTGHIEDATGLTYMQARYYDPVTGRFLAADPIGFTDQLNLYAYVGNDPANNRDPTGKYTSGGMLPNLAMYELYGPDTANELVQANNVGQAVGGVAGVAALGILIVGGPAAITALANPVTATELTIAATEALGGEALGGGTLAVGVGLAARGVAAESRALAPYFPAANGFIGSTSQATLRAGQVIDRYGGSAASRFFSPAGTSAAARALLPGTAAQGLRSFEVVKPFGVEAGQVAPAFNQIGLGTQYRSSMTLGELLEGGYLRELGP